MKILVDQSVLFLNLLLIITFIIDLITNSKTDYPTEICLIFLSFSYNFLQVPYIISQNNIVNNYFKITLKHDPISFELQFLLKPDRILCDIY